MKNKFAFIIGLLLASSTLFAQSNKEEIDLMQSVFGMQKKEMFSQFISLEGEKNDAFWALYDEYESKRKELGQNRIELIQKYAEQYNDLDDSSISKLISEAHSQKAKSDKLIYTYYNKIAKASGGKAGGQFYQIESYIANQIRVSIMESIPFIGELGN